MLPCDKGEGPLCFLVSDFYKWIQNIIVYWVLQRFVGLNFQTLSDKKDS